MTWNYNLYCTYFLWIIKISGLYHWWRTKKHDQSESDYLIVHCWNYFLQLVFQYLQLDKKTKTKYLPTKQILPSKMIHTMIHTFQWNYGIECNFKLVIVARIVATLKNQVCAFIQIAIALLVYTIFNLYVV